MLQHITGQPRVDQSLSNATAGDASHSTSETGSSAPAAKRLHHRRLLIDEAPLSAIKAGEGEQKQQQQQEKLGGQQQQERGGEEEQEQRAGEQKLQAEKQQVGEQQQKKLLPRINVVGSGKFEALGLPQELAGSVFVYKNLGYAEYFDTMCR